jgi:hypothetical protein
VKVFDRTVLWFFAAIIVLDDGCAGGAKHVPDGVLSSEARTGGEEPHAQAAGRTAAVTVALDWVAALRQRDSLKLAAQTAYPFRLRDTQSEGDCTDSEAAIASDLEMTLACLTTDELLHEDLLSNPSPQAEPVAAVQLPPWSRPWHAELAPGDVPVSVFVPGNGSAFYFVVIVADAGVRALWKHTTFESN